MLSLQSIYFSICSLNSQFLERSKGFDLMRCESRYSYLMRLQTLSLMVLLSVLPRYLCVLKYVLRQRSRGLLMFLQPSECSVADAGQGQLRVLKGRLQRQFARMLVIYRFMIFEVMTLVQIIIQWAMQQLIQMIDNFDCEQVVIRQYIKLRLEKAIDSPNELAITGLPFEIYRYCRDIFKRERLVNDYLYSQFQKIFYLRDLQELKEAKSDQLSNLYLKLLSEHASNKAILISQINLRCILLALSIRLAKKDTSLFKRKFKDFVKQLQLELVLNTQEILSDVLVRQIDAMRIEFDDLEYYEHLKVLFQRLEIDKVAKWIQAVLDQKRAKFQQKQHSTMPFKVEQKEAQGKSTKNLPVKSNLKQAASRKTIEGNQQKYSSTQAQSTLKSKTSEKDRKMKEPAMHERGSCISLANKLRKSMPGSSGRYSCKYVFKSTKKNQSQQVVYEDEEETKSPSINEVIQNYPTKIHPSTPVNRQQSEDENSRFLCAATPPRRNFRVLDQN